MKAEDVLIAYYVALRLGDPRQSPVKPEHFQDPEKAKLWEAALAGEPCLPPDVRWAPDYKQVQIAEAFLVKEWQRRYAREALQAAGAALNKGEDVASVHVKLETLMAEAAAGGMIHSETHKVVANRVLTRWIENLQDSKNRLLPVPWRSLEQHIGGWPLGKMIAVGGRSSEHKTTLARISAQRVAEEHKALYWTLEDSSEDLAARTLASGSVGLTTRDILTGQKAGRRPTADDLNFIAAGAAGQINAPWADRLHYYDEPSPKLSRVIGVLSAHAALGVSFAVLDYFQLIRPDRGRMDADGTRETLSALASLAKRLDMVVMVLSQIDKTGTQSSIEGKRVPHYSEMLFGTAIYQAAHTVIMLGKSDDVIEMQVQKCKTAERFGKMTLRVDAAHDRLVDG